MPKVLGWESLLSAFAYLQNGEIWQRCRPFHSEFKRATCHAQKCYRCAKYPCSVWNGNLKSSLGSGENKWLFLLVRQVDWTSKEHQCPGQSYMMLYPHMDPASHPQGDWLGWDVMGKESCHRRLLFNRIYQIWTQVKTGIHTSTLKLY